MLPIIAYFTNNGDRDLNCCRSILSSRIVDRADDKGAVTTPETFILQD